MTKYYNKDIPTEIHFVYGGRHSGKTYREFEKLKEKYNKLEEEYITLEKDYGTSEIENDNLRKRINKTIEILESKKHCERLCGGIEGKTFTEQAIEILKGEENDKD